MTFERYLASRRNPVRFMRARAKNPASVPADRLAEELNLHLQTIEDWINDEGVNRKAMLSAMDFFDRTFGDFYAAKPGIKLYRGQTGEKFNGDPRSYSTDSRVAEDFACGHWTGSPIIIERKVCHSCADKAAFRLTLDLGKLLAKYAWHKYGFEREVVILNTEPRGTTTQILEAQCT